MSILRHDFTDEIIKILDMKSGGKGDELLKSSEIIQYLNIKTKAANRGSKSRAGFANHYAIYVLIEDYLNGGFAIGGNYSDYEGAKFSDLFRRQRELPFGGKLQNHALNHRLNEEFKKYFPACDHLPIIRDSESNRYWINEQLIIVSVDGQMFNLAESIIEIIESYVRARQSAFSEFMQYCQDIIDIQEEEPEKAIQFIKGLFHPNVDARVFEIASFAVLKQHYSGQRIYWGWSPDELFEEYLVLYKTGRTNANDGGIDFVMKPLGRFFQVTETVDAGKYFLDIDKVQRYPITFVVKTNDSEEDILSKISSQAEAKYQIKAIVKKYIESVEEIINIPRLMEVFEEVLKSGLGAKVIEEIVLQSRVEFNVEAEEQDVLVFKKTVQHSGDQK
ncbi:restriction endonuclease [Geothermobacter hydrogeniphilus]|uniref:Restriction endonuclease n=1 Tax=Geothermobacter hydrogeniphilus TaxID=1969733 RepID=A0A1X0Y8C9_9BACT|nr:restriction endonuclease [Geothermobacter hydrogeniphilus]ORJ61359.1 restriction endonuclease [Geothermobacter hydrogeniphilus]